MSPARRRACGAMQVHERLAEENPAYRRNELKNEELTAQALRTGKAQELMRRIVKIPTVVHVVYKTGQENIGKQQVTSQVTVLNRDFRGQNPDKSKVPAAWSSMVADSKIEFVLAKRDPDGKPTDGITRTKTNRGAFGADDSVKKRSAGGVPAWPTNRYLNIWVCTLGSGLLGYAQFPGGPPAPTAWSCSTRHSGPRAPHRPRSTTAERRRTKWGIGSTSATSGATRWAARAATAARTPRTAPAPTTGSRRSRLSRATTPRTATCSVTTWITSTTPRCSCSPRVRPPG